MCPGECDFPYVWEANNGLTEHTNNRLTYQTKDAVVGLIERNNDLVQRRTSRYHIQNDAHRHPCILFGESANPQIQSRETGEAGEVQRTEESFEIYNIISELKLNISKEMT